MAKLFATEVALRASMESMRVHGGYGYTEEYEIARLYRDSPLMAIGDGTREIQRTIIARSLLGGTFTVKPGDGHYDTEVDDG